jgi:hypothetical protein
MTGDVQIGNIFSSSTWTGAQTACRSWHFRSTSDDSGHENPILHKIVFRHGQVSGNWVLIVDGILHMKGFEPILKRSFTVAFQLDFRESIITAVRRSTIGYNHSLMIDSITMMELKLTENPSIGEKLPHHISIPDCRTYSEGTRNVTLYQILVRPESGGNIIVEKRFSEFIALGDLLKAQKDNKTLQGTLPTLPSKTVMPWVDQGSESFITERREALEKYLQVLLRNPRVSC